jgi:hypothetical protein
MSIKKFIGNVIGTLIIAVSLLGFSQIAGAETHKFRITTYVTHFEVLPVGDVEGHILGTVSRKGLVFFENGEIATYTVWVTIDLIKGNGSFQGYSLTTYQDGSTQVNKLQGTLEAGMYKFTGEYVKGTKRFEGIKGTIASTGKSLTLYSKEKATFSDVYFDVTGTYTLPSK